MTESFSRQAARAAYGWRRDQNWAEALDLLSLAVDAGEGNAVRQLALVTQAPIDQLLKAPPARAICSAPRIFALDGFAPPGFSEWLIERSIERLQPAPANDATGEGGQVRTAQASGFGPEQWDLVVAIMQHRAANVVGTPVPFHEPPNTLSYEPGQQYHMHVDFIDPEQPQFHDELDYLGQRIATIVTYLNDDFEGAETYFPAAELKFRGKVGEAIAFSNVLPNGAPDRATGHAALPPDVGRKWVLSQWIRSKPWPFDPEALD